MVAAKINWTNRCWASWTNQTLPTEKELKPYLSALTQYWMDLAETPSVKLVGGPRPLQIGYMAVFAEVKLIKVLSSGINQTLIQSKHSRHLQPMFILLTNGPLYMQGLKGPMTSSE